MTLSCKGCKWEHLKPSNGYAGECGDCCRIVRSDDRDNYKPKELKVELPERIRVWRAETMQRGEEMSPIVSKINAIIVYLASKFKEEVK